MKKKILVLFMTVCMVFSLTACGSGGEIVDLVTNDTGENESLDIAKKTVDINPAGMKTISKKNCCSREKR